jgi:hypothetical protein
MLSRESQAKSVNEQHLQHVSRKKRASWQRFERFFFSPDF